MFGSVPLPLDWPVYVTQSEALAYANWKRKDLLTEAQWHRAAGDGMYPWGNEGPNPERGNFDFHRWDPVPVTAKSVGARACVRAENGPR